MSKLALAGARLERDSLVDAIIEGGLWQLLDGVKLPRSQDEFASVQRAVTAQWVPHVLEMGNHLAQAIKVASDTWTVLSRYGANEYAEARADMEQQLQMLFSPKSLIETPV